MLLPVHISSHLFVGLHDLAIVGIDVVCSIDWQCLIMIDSHKDDC